MKEPAAGVEERHWARGVGKGLWVANANQYFNNCNRCTSVYLLTTNSGQQSAKAFPVLPISQVKKLKFNETMFGSRPISQ